MRAGSAADWPYDALATYHGWIVDEDENGPPDDVRDGPGIVAVEISEFGPTEREGTIELYRLAPDGFHWGYTGSGPQRVADAILRDALGIGP